MATSVRAPAPCDSVPPQNKIWHESMVEAAKATSEAPSESSGNLMALFIPVAQRVGDEAKRQHRA
jgi:hypothetical protein